jgi:hypothetical protein
MKHLEVSDRPRLAEGSQGRQTVKYGHESRGTRNQESLCWRGPVAIWQSVFEGLRFTLLFETVFDSAIWQFSNYMAQCASWENDIRSDD